MLAESNEERKYPRWLRYFAVLYGIVVLWTTFSLPPSGYDFDSLMLVFLLWFPVLLGLLYIAERPGLVSRHLKALRITMLAFMIIAMLVGLMLSYAFME